mgnify:CR=1 FL=1
MNKTYIELLKTILKAFLPLFTLFVGIYMGEPTLFFLSGVFASIYLSIPFQKIEELFVGLSGIKVKLDNLRGALEDLILLLAKITTDMITYRNRWGMPEELLYKYIKELESILANIEIEDKNKLKGVLNRIFVFYHDRMFDDTLYATYKKLLDYLSSKGVNEEELEQTFNVYSIESPNPPSKSDLENFLKRKGIEVDENLDNILQEYDRAFNEYTKRINEIKERLQI